MDISMYRDRSIHYRDPTRLRLEGSQAGRQVLLTTGERAREQSGVIVCKGVENMYHANEALDKILARANNSRSCWIGTPNTSN